MSKPQETFDAGRIADFRNYEAVRASGAYNMFDPRARDASGLTREEFLFVMDNFSALKAAADKEQS